MAQARMNPALTAFMFHTVAKVTSFAKFSFIVGSQTAFFAPAAVLLPLAGAFGGVMGSFSMLGMGLLMRALFVGAMPLAFLAYHLPGFCASLYWGSNSKLVKVVPALLCTVLFLAHPVGAQSAWYSLFWLAPIIAAYLPYGLLSTALGSSFTAHAVGTVVWLYAGLLHTHDFVLLVPVVIVERLMIAVAMVLAYKAIEFAYSKVSIPQSLSVLIQK